MTASDQFKLLKAGFTIIRPESTHVVSHTFENKIKAKTIARKDWHTMEEGFKTRAEMDRRVKALLANSMIVAD